MAEAGEAAAALGISAAFLRDSSEFSAIPYVVDVLERSRESQEAGATRISEIRHTAVSEAERRQYQEDLDRINEEVARIIEVNYEGFADSVQGFSAIFQEFTEAQAKVRKLKDYIQRSKETLVTRKRNIKDLYFQKKQHIRALEILQIMEDIQAAPRRIDQFLEEEKFVECVDVFLKAFHESFSSELAGIDALNEIREELVAHREKLHEALIEALVGYLASSGATEDSAADTEAALASASGAEGESGPGRIGAERLSKRAVISLDSIVLALNKLDRLPAALHTVKAKLREQLDAAIETRMERAAAFKRPVGLAASSEELDDARLESMFREVLSEFRGIFTRHVQFSLILQAEAAEIGDKHYAIQQTWSTIQVEVQQLLELHLAASSEHYSRSQSQQQNRTGARFSFSDARLEGLDVARTVTSSLAASRRRPICPPSPFRLFSLLDPLVRFAKYGDQVAETAARPQLLGFVRDYCNDTLLPQLRGEILSELRRVTLGEQALEPTENPASRSACCTNVGTVVAAQLERLAANIEPLSLISIGIEPVVQDLLSHFVDYCQSTTSALLAKSGKLAGEWEGRMHRLLKEDPYYLNMISIAPETDLAKFRQDCADHNQNERDKERQVAVDLLGSGRVAEADLSQRLLSGSQMMRLAALHSTCDLLFRSLAHQGAVDEIGVDGADRSSSCQQSMSSEFLEVVNSSRVASVLASSKVRTQLARIDKVAEETLFALRCELRIRCISGLRGLPFELLRGVPNSTCAASVVHGLVKCTRTIKPFLIDSHSSFLVRSLCSLLAELVVRVLPAVQPELAKAAQADRRTTAPRLGKGHLRFLNQTMLLLQQAMWTLLLSSFDSPQNGGQGAGEAAVISQWRMAQDQLAAFDGARRFLLQFETADKQEYEASRQAASSAMLGSVSVAELERFQSMFANGRPG